MERPFRSGLSLSATRSRDGHKARRIFAIRSAPDRILRCRPPRIGAAFLQHRLYTASALAVDVPPDRRQRPGSRGDSLHGLVHTSPLRNRERPGRGTVATPRDICTTGSADRSPEQLQKKTAVEVTLNDCQGDTLSNGGCSPRIELIRRSRHRSYVTGTRCNRFSVPPLYDTLDLLSTPHILGQSGYVTYFPLSPAAGIGGPRPDRRTTRAGSADRGDCGTGFLVGSLARRPQAAELWGAEP